MNDIASEYLVELIKSLRGLKSTAEKGIEQVNDDELNMIPDPESNSIHIIMKHMAGNMISRFTDFLTTDGEKPWRKRDEEFTNDSSSREKLMEFWNRGWNCLTDSVSQLTPDDLMKTVYIRGEAHSVIRALQRQLSHYAYHTGQLVYICKLIRSSEFKTLSIAKGQSAAYRPNVPGKK